MLASAARRRVINLILGDGGVRGSRSKPFDFGEQDGNADRLG